MCRIWSTLGRKIKDDVKLQQDRYSLIYAENPFIVPGGRFRETYYWDSYWVIKGLLICEMKDTARGMLENFVSLIKRYGMIPNGNRVYYTRRSQPPLFIAMVEEYIHFTGDQDFLEQNIAYMETEYMFWMANRSVEVGYNGHQHLVNRYAAPITEPRPESYREDIDTVKTANLGQRHVEPSLLYSSLASAAESGWDFSSRWFSAGYAQEDSMVDWLGYTDTSNVVPVDLNAILCWNERLLADMFRTLGQTAKATIYKNKHELRKEQMHDLFWDNNTGAWFDFSVTTHTHRKNFYPSNIFPVFAGCFEHSQEVEEKVLHYLKDAGVLNYVSGIPTSTVETGQQWDFPNAWPPLQHVVIQALAGSSNLQMRHEALQLTQGWINSNFAGWKRTGHMFEKYVVTKSGSRGSGGEYDVQDGFGWTNGVVLDLLYSFGQDLYYNDPDTVNHCNIVSAPAVQWFIIPVCVAQTFLQQILTNPRE